MRKAHIILPYLEGSIEGTEESSACFNCLQIGHQNLLDNIKGRKMITKDVEAFLNSKNEQFLVAELSAIETARRLLNALYFCDKRW